MKLKRFLARPIALGAGVGALAALCFLIGIFSSWSARATDRFFITQDADPSVLMVAIDDSSIAEIGRWPWPRTVHAELLSKMHAADVVAYDVMFSEVSNASDDAALANAVQESGNVVLPVELALRQSSEKITFDPRQTIATLSEISIQARAVGHVNTPPDTDGIVRRIPLRVASPSGDLTSAFALRAYETAHPGDAIHGVPVDRYDRLLVRYLGNPGTRFETVSAADVIRSRIDPSVFQGRAVFVGATAQDLHDNQLVPTSDGTPMPGVEIHATLYDTLLQEAWISPMPTWIAVLSLIILGAFLGAVLPWIRARWSPLFALGLWVVWIIAAAILFERGVVVDVLWPSAVIILAYAIIMLERRVTADRERARLRTAFSRYVSEPVVEQILQNPRTLELGGQKREMTVLFSDLRGFTTLSESLDPEALVDILNVYLTRMTQVIFDHSGVLDKYIGDAVMAFWNAPFDQPSHAELAVRTAIAMRDELASMNAEGVFPKGVTLKMGIGVNTGDMVVGNVGGETRFDYTVIGDAVNLGARIESTTKEYGAEILISEATYHRVSDIINARRVGEVTVKGKTEPVVLYEVQHLKDIP